MDNIKNRILSIGVFDENSRCYSLLGPYLSEIDKQTGFSFYLNYLDYYKNNGSKNFNDYLLKFITENKISHVFIFLTGWDFLISPRTLEGVSKITSIILFTFDTEYYFENLERYYAQYADLVVTTDKFSSFAFQELNINSYCAFAMYDGINKFKNKSLIKDLDVTFIGNLNIGKRKNYISFLKNNNINVHDFGLNTTNGIIDEEEMVNIINRSKIVLNFTGLQNFKKMPPGIPRIRSRIRQSKGRPIETVLCGAFLLTEYSPGIQYMYDTESQVAVFSTQHELLKKIKYYLENESIREKMALNAYNYSLENYELKNGLHKIFKVMDEVNHIDSETEFYIDEQFKVEFYMTHLKLAFLFLFKFKIKALWQELIILVNTNGFSIKRLLQEIIWFRTRFIEKFRTIS